MISIGIDVASEKHDVCILSDDGEIIRESFQIVNTKKDYNRLNVKIQNLCKITNDFDVRIGIESTGSYSFTILNYFASIQNYKVIYINPVLTNLFQLSRSIHYAKTDKADAYGIALFVSKKVDFPTYTPQSYQTLELKSLYREIHSINKEQTCKKNQLYALIHKVFPEVFGIIKTIDSNGFLKLLSQYPTPNSISKLRVSTIKKIFSNSGGHVFSDDEIKYIITSAKDSIGVYSNADGLMISQYARTILFNETKKKETIKAIKPIVDENYPYLLKIKGISYISAAGIVGEIGDISNFQSSDSVLAFAGLDLVVYQSGKYNGKELRISRKGSVYLRNALHNAADCVRKFDPTFAAYYEKKRLEGKTHKTALNNCKKKLVRVIFSVLKNKSYIEPVI